MWYNNASIRCGEDLKTLFLSAEVQHFLNSVPMRQARAEKAIYQPGTLRLVSLASGIVAVTVEPSLF